PFPAGARLGPGGQGPQQHRHGARHGHDRRHAVHAVRRAGVLLADRQGARAEPGTRSADDGQSRAPGERREKAMGHVNRPTALIAPCLLLASCMLGPDSTRPTVATPEAWRNAPSAVDSAASIANLPWWELFSDEELRSYLTAALEANHDLRIAVTRVDQARAR